MPASIAGYAPVHRLLQHVAMDAATSIVGHRVALGGELSRHVLHDGSAVHTSSATSGPVQRGQVPLLATLCGRVRARALADLDPEPADRPRPRPPGRAPVQSLGSVFLNEVHGAGHGFVQVLETTQLSHRCRTHGDIRAQVTQRHAALCSDPFVLQHLVASHPDLRVSTNHAQDQVLGVGGQVQPARVLHTGGILDRNRGILQRLALIRVVRLAPHQHYKQQHSQPVDIHRRRVRLVEDNLWRDKARRPDAPSLHRSLLSHLLFRIDPKQRLCRFRAARRDALDGAAAVHLPTPGKAQIQDLDHGCPVVTVSAHPHLHLILKHHVFRLDIAMNHALLVKVRHRLHNLLENPGRILFAIGVAHHVNAFQQIRPSEVLKLVHQHPVTGWIHVPAFDKVRVRQIVQQLALLQQQLPGLLVQHRVVYEDNLQSGHAALFIRMLGQHDLGEVPVPKLCQASGRVGEWAVSRVCPSRATGSFILSFILSFFLLSTPLSTYRGVVSNCRTLGVSPSPWRPRSHRRPRLSGSCPYCCVL
mmetsp:Transcript_10483/g.28744  ORF Transcript_10483/g.28744 Transcript_10483/m.28744 type:complete len:531 (+) Transcript_10483:402-1994(+)